MPIIKKREKPVKKVAVSFRIRSDLAEKIEKIAREAGENKTYVLESLLEYAVEGYEKEKSKKSKKGMS